MSSIFSLARCFRLLSLVLGLIFSAGAFQVAMAAPITGVDVIAGDNANISRAGWEKVNLDLNKGAGGKFIYLLVQHGTGTPVVNLAVVNGKNAAAPPGYTKINVDLNAGAGGDFLYLCYQKSSSGRPLDSLKVISGGNSGIQSS